MLQNLANDHLFEGKEAFMQPMNAFIASTKDTLRKYFDNLIQVTEPENYLVIQV